MTLGFWGLWLWWRKRLFDQPLFLKACVAMSPAGFIAVVLGWMTAEVGRQPWVVYGVLRTRDAVSPVPAGHVAFSLVAYFLIYALVFSAGALFIMRLLNRGPDEAGEAPPSDAPGLSPWLGSGDAS